jgi:hypothetical protein
LVYEVERWRQAGRVFLWTYRTTRPRHSGWNLTADNQACAALLELSAAMRQLDRGSHRTINLTPPDADVLSVPNFGVDVARSGPDALVLAYAPDFDDLLLTRQDQRMTLRFGAARAGEIVAAIQDISAGRGDYPLHPNAGDGDDGVWIWWLPHRRR